MVHDYGVGLSSTEHPPAPTGTVLLGTHHDLRMWAGAAPGRLTVRSVPPDRGQVVFPLAGLTPPQHC